MRALAVAALAVGLVGCGGDSHIPTSTSSKTPSGSYDRASADPAGLGRRHILIADQFNNRVVEVTATGEIVWHFGLGPNDISARSIIGVNDAERIGHGLTLMAGTGAPPGTEPLCPNAAPTTVSSSSTTKDALSGNTATSVRPAADRTR